MGDLNDLENKLCRLLRSHSGTNSTCSKYEDLKFTLQQPGIIAMTTFCRTCNILLSWTESDTNDNSSDTFILTCHNCERSVLEFDATSASKMLAVLLKAYHPQIACSHVNLVTAAVGQFYAESPPAILNNSFHILESIYRCESPELVYLGGTSSSKILADIFYDKHLRCPPILFFTTTGSLSQRFFCHGLKFNRYRKKSKSRLLQEFGNLCFVAITTNCKLLICPNLEKQLDLAAIQHVKPTNMKIVSFKNYKSRQNLSSTTKMRKLRRMTRACRRFCLTVNQFVLGQINEQPEECSEDVVLEMQQKALNVAVWIKEFYGTPLTRCIEIIDT